MIQFDTVDHSDELANAELALMEVFAGANGKAFDRTLARAVLAEALRSVPGDDAGDWAERQSRVADSLGLRVHTLMGGLNDVIPFARHSLPVATLVKRPNGAPLTVVINSLRRGRFAVTILDRAMAERKLSKSQLIQLLGGKEEVQARCWTLGQSALTCSGSESSDGGTPKKLAPLSRLLHFIAPDKLDIWIVVIFSMIVGVLALATPIAVEALVNTVSFGRWLQPVLILALMLCVFLGFGAALRALTTLVVEIFQRRLLIRVVDDLAHRLPRVKAEDMETKHGPELANRFFDVVTVQKSAASLLLDGTSIVLQTLIGMVVIAFYHPYLLGFDIALLLMITITIFLLGRKSVKTAIVESKKKYEVAAWLEELARHPTVFRTEAGALLATERADKLTAEWLDSRRKHFRVLFRQIVFALSLQVIAGTALLGLGGFLVIQRELTLGQLVAAELIVMAILGSFAKFGKHMESWYDLLASIDKLGALFDLSTEESERLLNLDSRAPAAVSVNKLSANRYDETVFQNLAFDVEAGDRVALTGENVHAKSALLDMLFGLRQPASGNVLIDGVDASMLRPDALRNHVAITKSSEIFHGTLEENLRLSRSQITAKDLQAALDLVGLSHLQDRLTKGLFEEVSTHGLMLTRAEAAKLSLARAVVARPRLLLIDETLDILPDDEAEVVLRRLSEDHRPWTLILHSGHDRLTSLCQRSISLDGKPGGRPLAATH